MYSHQNNLQSKTKGKMTHIYHTNQCVLTRPFSLNYHLVLFLANYIPKSIITKLCIFTELST